MHLLHKAFRCRPFTFGQPQRPAVETGVRRTERRGSRSPPVTTAGFVGFVDAGGYRRGEVWRDQGWAWRPVGAEHPLCWSRGVDWLKPPLASIRPSPCLLTSPRFTSTTRVRPRPTAGGREAGFPPRPSGSSPSLPKPHPTVRPSPPASASTPGATPRQPPATPTSTGGYWDP